jgi:hypothetical protein
MIHPMYQNPKKEMDLLRRYEEAEDKLDLCITAKGHEYNGLNLETAT